MAIACDSASLVAAAKCFECIPDDMRAAVELYLVASLAAATAGTSMDPGTLVKAAACFKCVPRDMREALLNYLLCQIAKASGA